MRKSIMLATVLAAAGMAIPALPHEPDTRPTSRRKAQVGWPKFRRDHAQQREIKAHNKAVEQRKRDRLAGRQAKRMAEVEA